MRPSLFDFVVSNHSLATAVVSLSKTSSRNPDFASTTIFIKLIQYWHFILTNDFEIWIILRIIYSLLNVGSSSRLSCFFAGGSCLWDDGRSRLTGHYCSQNPADLRDGDSSKLCGMMRQQLSKGEKTGDASRWKELGQKWVPTDPMFVEMSPWLPNLWMVVNCARDEISLSVLVLDAGQMTANKETRPMMLSS